MNLNQLRYFTSLAETKSFKTSAEKCCVTQPTLSNGIAHLEEELGGKLFRRTTRTVDLTPFGTFVVPMAQSILDAKDELIKSAQSFFHPELKVLRIGMSPLIAHTQFPNVIKTIKDQAEWTEVFLKHCFMDDMATRLQNETVDLILIPRQSGTPFANSIPLYKEPLFYIPPQTDLGAQQTTNPIEIASLDATPVILTNGCGLSDVIKDCFAQAGATLMPYPGQALNYNVVVDWAELGLAGGILPKSQIHSHVTKACPLMIQGKPAMIQYQACWNPDHPHHPFLKETAQLIAEILTNVVTYSAIAKPAS